LYDARSCETIVLGHRQFAQLIDAKGSRSRSEPPIRIRAKRCACSHSGHPSQFGPMPACHNEA